MLFTYSGKLDHLNVFLLDARTTNCQNVHFNIVVFTKTRDGEVRLCVQMRDNQVFCVFPHSSYRHISFTNRYLQMSHVQTHILESGRAGGGKRDTTSVKHSTCQTKMVKNGLTNPYSLYKGGPPRAKKI